MISVCAALLSIPSFSGCFDADDNPLRSALAYIGWPVMALSVGVWLAYRNIRTAAHRKESTSRWVEEGLRTSAMTLVVTGLGGSLSEILKARPAVDCSSSFFAAKGLTVDAASYDVLWNIGYEVSGLARHT